MEMSLVERALKMALSNRQPEPGRLHHLDCGGQYAAPTTKLCSSPAKSPLVSAARQLLRQRRERKPLGHAQDRVCPSALR
jgi:hypothetical protein